MILRVGLLIVTNYCCDLTRPYRIDRLSGPCSCARGLDEVDGKKHWPSEPHYHLTCTRGPRPGMKRREKGWLNGYRLDGHSVWGNDRILAWHGHQLALFSGPKGSNP